MNRTALPGVPLPISQSAFTALFAALQMMLPSGSARHRGTVPRGTHRRTHLQPLLQARILFRPVNL